MTPTSYWPRNGDTSRYEGRYAEPMFGGAEYGPMYGDALNTIHPHAHRMQEMMAHRYAMMSGHMPTMPFMTAPAFWPTHPAGGWYGRMGSMMGGTMMPTRYSDLAFERPMGRGPRNYRRPDERIAEEICERIARSGVFADEVEIMVNAGEVTITGMVEDRHDKRLIEELTDSVFGVRDVHNQLRVRETDTRMTGGPVRATVGGRM